MGESNTKTKCKRFIHLIYKHYSRRTMEEEKRANEESQHQRKEEEDPKETRAQKIKSNFWWAAEKNIGEEARESKK